jgi:hypothetical protein
MSDSESDDDLECSADVNEAVRPYTMREEIGVVIGEFQAYGWRLGNAVVQLARWSGRVAWVGYTLLVFANLPLFMKVRSLPRRSVSRARRASLLPRGNKLRSRVPPSLTPLSVSSTRLQVFDEMKYRELLDKEQDRWVQQGYSDEQIEVLTEREKAKVLNG